MNRAQTQSPPRSTGYRVELIVDEAHLQRVVWDGLARAKVSVDIATADFKAVMLPQNNTRQAISIIELFRRLAGRGVEVRLLHAGVPSGPALAELREDVPAGLSIRRCPRLHAKFVVVDAAGMYLGSANLTGAGLGAKSPERRNFEMGIWTTRSDLIDQAMARFNQLWEGHRCDNCKRRDVCPVPLEEPDLG